MFSYAITEEQTTKCVAVNGRIDALSAPDVQKLFDQLIAGGERVLLIDMTSVNYVSSAGLRIFLSIQKQLKKVSGEIILFGMNAQVFDLFKMSGLTTFFHITPGKEEARSFVEKSRGNKTTTSVNIEGIRMEYRESTAEKGSLFIIGSSEKTATSAYKESDVVPVESSRMQFGCGFAALGNTYGEYKDLFGEAMVINGSFFFYPAVKHPSVDFLIDARKDPGIEYRFLHGFGFNGQYRYIISFEGTESYIDLATLAKAFLSLSPASVLGVLIIAESKGLWGMHMKKVPLEENRPDNGKSVFDESNFSRWIDFPVEPSHMNHAVVATGIIGRDRDSAGPEIQSLIAEKNNHHMHGAIFGKTPLNRNIDRFDDELIRIFSELDANKIQHLLGRSTISGGIAAIVELDA